MNGFSVPNKYYLFFAFKKTIYYTDTSYGTEVCLRRRRKTQNSDDCVIVISIVSVLSSVLKLLHVLPARAADVSW